MNASPDPDRTWVVLSHVSGLLLCLGMPFGNVIGPLVIWLLKRHDPEVDVHGREALNFQLSITLYLFLAGLSLLVIIGWVLLPLVFLAYLVLTIMGSVKASNGELYRYPFTIRFVN